MHEENNIQLKTINLVGKKVGMDRNTDWHRINKDVMDRTGTICLATGHQRSLRTNYYSLGAAIIFYFV